MATDPYLRDKLRAGADDEHLTPTCPACGSANGFLGTSHAYFTCTDCKKIQYWTTDHAHPNDWLIAVALSPWAYLQRQVRHAGLPIQRVKHFVHEQTQFALITIICTKQCYIDLEVEYDAEDPHRTSLCAIVSDRKGDIRVWEVRLPVDAPCSAYIDEDSTAKSLEETLAIFTTFLKEHTMADDTLNPTDDTTPNPTDDAQVDDEPAFMGAGLLVLGRVEPGPDPAAFNDAIAAIQPQEDVLPQPLDYPYDQCKAFTGGGYCVLPKSHEGDCQH